MRPHGKQKLWESENSLLSNVQFKQCTNEKITVCTQPVQHRVLSCNLKVFSNLVLNSLISLVLYFILYVGCRVDISCNEGHKNTKKSTNQHCYDQFLY